MELRAPTAGDLRSVEHALRGELAVGKTIYDSGDWRVHDGDLVIAGDWPNADSIVVLGSVASPSALTVCRAWSASV